jgi:hypothetical protein
MPVFGLGFLICQKWLRLLLAALMLSLMATIEHVALSHSKVVARALRVQPSPLDLNVALCALSIHHVDDVAVDQTARHMLL